MTCSANQKQCRQAGPFTSLGILGSMRPATLCRLPFVGSLDVRSLGAERRWQFAGLILEIGRHPDKPGCHIGIGSCFCHFEQRCRCLTCMEMVLGHGNSRLTLCFAYAAQAKWRDSVPQRKYKNAQSPFVPSPWLSPRQSSGRVPRRHAAELNFNRPCQKSLLWPPRHRIAAKISLDVETATWRGK